MRNEVGRGVTEMDAAGDTEDTVQGSKSAEGVEGSKTQRNGARSEVRAESRADETGLSESQITESQAESQKMQAQKMQTGETALDGSARSIVVLVVVGLLVGVLSGTFGIGGGTVIVPALVWLGLSQRNAAATSTLAIVPTSISGVISYATGGHVDWLAAALLFCMFVGGQIGSWLLSRLPELVLRWIFVAFLVFVVINQVSFVPSRDHQIAMTVVTGVGLALLGVVIGTLAGLLGIGGCACGAVAVDSVRRVRPGCARHVVAGHVPEFDYDQCGEPQTQVGARADRADYWCDRGRDRAARYVDCGGGFATSWGDYVRLLSVRAAGAVRVRGRKGHARGAGCAVLSGAGIFPSGWMI